MRIAYAAHDRANYYGGPIVNARRLLPELRRRGHEVAAMVVYNGETPSKEYLRSKGVEVRSTPWVSDTETLARWFLEQLRDYEPDMFVSNVSVAAGFAGRWAREAGIPTLAAYLGVNDFCWGLVEQFALAPAPWALSGLTCCSDALRARVEKEIPRNTRVFTLWHGVPTVDKVPVRDGVLRLAYIGRLVDEQKQITKLIQAIGRVLEVRSDVCAKIIGEGREREKVETLVRESHLEDRITFTGGVEPDDLFGQLADCHAVVLLSDYEGFGSCMLDGMACGLAVVCLDCPDGVRELCVDGKTGFLVHDRDQDFLAAVCRLADDDSLRQRLAQNALDYAREHYSVQKMASDWERCFESLRSEAEPRRPMCIPHKLDLPPVNPALASEDIRREKPRSSLVRSCIRKARRIVAPLKIRGA